MALLMACIAAMPSAEGRRARAFMTEIEKAKKSPPINPHPSAVISVNVKSKLSIIWRAPLGRRASGRACPRVRTAVGVGDNVVYEAAVNIAVINEFLTDFLHTRYPAPDAGGGRVPCVVAEVPGLPAQGALHAVRGVGWLGVIRQNGHFLRIPPQSHGIPLYNNEIVHVAQFAVRQEEPIITMNRIFPEPLVEVCEIRVP